MTGGAQSMAYSAGWASNGWKPYPAYKPSGLPWLGDMPTNWNTMPNRSFLRRRKTLVGSRHPEYTLLSLTKAGVIVRDISTGKGKFSSDMGTCQEVHPGDLIFCLFDVPETPRTVGLSAHAGMITGAYTIFECDDPLFAHYIELFYKAMDDRKLLSPLYSGLRNTIPPSTFLGMKSPVPPPEDQDAIVRFLDHHDRLIRKYIRAKQKLIALLAEQKQAIIQRAVTRGLNPDVKLKLSGVDRLGDIPEHWSFRRLKYLVLNVNNQVAEKEQEEIYVPMESVKSWTGTITPQVSDVSFDSSVKRFLPDDLLFGKLRPYLAKVARPQTKGVCVGEFLVLRVTASEISPGFLENVLRSKSFIDLVNASTSGAKMPRADWGFIGGIPIAFPNTLSEQESILAEVRGKAVAYQNAIDSTDREIALMREYRTRLTADVVTGKIDVREAAAALPAINYEVPVADSDLDETSEEEEALDAD